MLAALAVAPGRLTGPGAVAVIWLGYDPAGRLLTGLLQVAFVVAAAAAVAVTLRHRRFRLLAGVAAGAAAAGAALAGILSLTGDTYPHAVTAAAGHSWLASAAFPGPALPAAAAAVTVAVSPWLSRPWHRAAWVTLGAAGAARLITGTVLPAELILALAAGVTVGAGVLVAFGVPDRRIGPDEIAAALRSAGLSVASAEPAGVQTKGSRPFLAVTDSGRRLFIKALGSDQRDADLLYRAYRFALMGAVAHLILLVIFFTLAGHQLAHAFRLPPASKLLLILAVAAALAGTVLATRRGRRLATTRLLPGLRIAAASLRTVAASPAKLTLLAGGSALITLAYIGGLAASVQAFGGHAGITEIGAVYLGAAIIAAASPTPGGLGAIEAALVAGLTGIGVPPGPAVSAVLTYRLATYWLPVIPGWAAWRLLQRQDYV